jgi:uncharacterized protein YjbJ (UPF0337 family)
MSDRSRHRSFREERIKNEDEIKSVGRDAVGKVKNATDGLTGDTGLQAEGKLDQAEGKIQGQYGVLEGGCLRRQRG